MIKVESLYVWAGHRGLVSTHTHTHMFSQLTSALSLSLSLSHSLFIYRWSIDFTTIVKPKTFTNGTVLEETRLVLLLCVVKWR